MSGYLENLVLRTVPRGPLLRPRVRSVFEPQHQDESLDLISSGINNSDDAISLPKDVPGAPRAGIRFSREKTSDLDDFSHRKDEESESSIPLKTKPVDASHSNRVIDRVTPDVSSKDSRLHQNQQEFDSETQRRNSTGTGRTDDSASMPLQSVPDSVSRSGVSPVSGELGKQPVRVGSPLTPQFQGKGEHNEREKDTGIAKTGVLRPSSVSSAISKNQIPVVSKKESAGPAHDPIVHVTIGRVEIKAVTSHQQATPVQRNGKGPISLEEYLRKRSREQN